MALNINATTVKETWLIDKHHHNKNITQIKVEKIKVKTNFKNTFSLSDKQADKTVYRLQKKMLKAIENDTKVKADIFIADTTPVMNFELDEPLEGFHLAINLNNENEKVVVFTQEGKLSSTEATAIFKKYKQRQEKKRMLHFKARQENLKTILALIKDDLSSSTIKQFHKAIEKGAPYLSLKLSPHVIIELLNKHNGAISVMDKHISFSPSTDYTTYEINQTMRDEWIPRLEQYKTKRFVDSIKNNPDKAYINWEGQGVNIYYANGQCPDQNDTNKTYYGYTPPTLYNIETVYEDNGNLYTGDSAHAYHTKIITGILSSVSPDASLTCKNAHLVSNYNSLDYDNTSSTIYDDVFPDSNNSFFIETYSLNMYYSAEDNDSTRDYYPMDALFDTHAYENDRLIFVSAGNNEDHKDPDRNPGNDVISPAKAFNVLTVGNYALDEYGSAVLNESSSYNNPLLDGDLSKSYQKPEITAPGTDFFFLTMSKYHVGNDTTYTYTDALDSGTSFSTPFAAAIAANLISSFATAVEGEYNTSILALPAMYKAAVISLARDSVYAEGNLTNSQMHSRVGEGGLNYDTVPTLHHLIARDEYFTLRSDGKECYDTNMISDVYADFMQMNSYESIRVVIAWFNKVDIATSNTINRIPNTYSLEIFNPSGNIVSFYDYNGTYRSIAEEPNQGYQVINFRTGSTATGKYVARICKTDNHDGEDIKIGFAMTQKPYTPSHSPAPGVMQIIMSYLLW